MSYDIAVWVGERPESDDAAALEYEARYDAEDGQGHPTNPRLVNFVSALLRHFPEGLDDGVWAFEPLLNGDEGDILTLCMLVAPELDERVRYSA